MTVAKHIKPVKAPKSIIDNIKQVKKIVHYYEVLVGYNSRFIKTSQYPFIDLMQALIKDIGNSNYEQHVFDEKTFFIPQLSFDSIENLYQGKLYSVRSEDFPQLINLNTKSIRDIDAAADDGIVEASHFIIDCNANYPKVAFEYNQYGGKINDLLRCLNFCGIRHSITEGMRKQNIVRDDLESFVQRMGRYSRLTVKVQKDNLGVIKNISSGLASGLEGVIDRFDSDYALIELKFNYREKQGNRKALEMVSDVISGLLKNRSNVNAFEIFTVEAEDVEHNNRIQAFDLLLDRVRSEIRVERREKSRTISSDSMFFLMKTELKKIGI